MRRLRTLNSIVVMLCGLAIAFALFGAIGRAIVAHSIAVILVAWSIEKLRFAAFPRQPEKRP